MGDWLPGNRIKWFTSLRTWLFFCYRNALNCIAGVIRALLWVAQGDAFDHVHTADNLTKNGISAI